MKLLGYQIVAIVIIWAGMVSFYAELDDTGKIFFYVVSGWLLFLIISFIKQKMGKQKDNDTE